MRLREIPEGRLEATVAIALNPFWILDCRFWIRVVSIANPKSQIQNDEKICP
jgi:hypothetical protein